MKEERFNRWFNAFILIGMAVAVFLVTIFKLQGTQTGKWLLILSAFGSLMGVCSSVSSANGRIITFLFGLIDVSLYGAMCFVSWNQGNSGLGNAILHFLYFVPMQFVGYAQWKKRGASGRSEVKARRLDPRRRVLYSVVFLAGSAAAYFILSGFDKSAAGSFIRWAVVLDVLPLMCNIVGQLLMSTAYADQWFFWIGVNVFSICMWTRNLVVSPDSSYALVYVIKYSFYLLNSLNGLRIWWKLSRNEASL